MANEEKKLKHIQVKDNGIKLSNKVGDVLSDAKAILENKIATELIKGIENPATWVLRQNILIRDFKKETSIFVKETNKNVKETLKKDTTVNLTNKQVLSISNQINKGTLLLENQAIKAYQNAVIQTQLTLRVNKSIELKEALSKHLQTGLNFDVVYADGKTYKFDSYWEMKARTEIQKDIGSNMVSAGKEAGVIFYIAAYFGDCAKDHVNYQGKIYVDKDWESNAPKDRIEEIRSYIESHKIMTVQEVMDAPCYFTTRPNCRHYFQYISIDEVLGAKNQDDVNKLRNERNLNFNGKYRPEKYKALQQQRLNERQIRATKEDVAKQEIQLSLNPGDKTIQSKILSGEERIKQLQANQRELVKEYKNLERDYNREQVRLRADLDAKNQPNLTSSQNSSNIVVEVDSKGLLCQHKDFFVEPLDKNEFNRLKKEFEAKGGLIVQDESAQEYLKYRNADALTFNSTTILLKPNPTASEVHEELIHAEQMANGRGTDEGNGKEKLECEIEAARILIANKEKFKITDVEHEYNKQRLKKELQDLKEGNYDKYK